MFWSEFFEDCGGFCQVARQAIFTAIVWVPLAVMAWWAWGWPLAYSPWVVYDDVEMLTPAVKPGEPVFVRWSYTVRHDCPRDIEMRLRENGAELLGAELLLYAHRGRTTGGEPGPRGFTSEILLPVLAPGEYALLSASTGNCTPLYSETVRAAPVKFSVVPPD